MKRLVFLVLALTLVMPAARAYAGTPDGDGPWADFVVSVNQGFTKGGTRVPPERSNPAAALGEAETSGALGTFFSLGFGGEIVLGFENVLATNVFQDVEVVEVIWESYPREEVSVFVSQDGSHFEAAVPKPGTNATSDANTRSSKLSMPADWLLARFVKLVDVTDRNNPEFPSDADGFDVTGVMALHNQPGVDCVLTQGYYKTHPDQWPATHTDGSTKLYLGSTEYTQDELLSILEKPPKGNGLIALAHQLIAAKLNIVSGAPVPVAVISAIQAADTLMNGLVVPPVGTDSLPPKDTGPLTVILDRYNRGEYIGGPPHCE